MASFRLLNFLQLPARNAVSTHANLFKTFNFDVVVKRGIRYSFANTERIMKERRKLAGPDRIRKRNEWLEWNYQAELFAFPKRLHEEISERTLKTVFTHQSYIDQEEQRRKEFGLPMEDVPLDLNVNTSLIAEGQNIMVPYIQGFVRFCYKMLPEEGVSAFCSFLMSDNVLSHVSSNIGTTDLILTADFPVEKQTLKQTLKALVGGIAQDNGIERAQIFVHDFVCTQLIGKHLQEIWEIPNPKTLLDDILKKHGRLPYEPRLVFESGRNTLESVYLVALYSNKVFLGQDYGETLSIAENMAVCDTLARLFGQTLSERELPYGEHSGKLKFNPEEKNMSLQNWYCGSFKAESDNA